MVPRVGQNLHEDEALDNPQRNGSIRAPPQHHVQPPRLNLPQRITERVRRRSATRRDDMTRATQPEAYVQLTRKRTHYTGWHAEQAHLLVLLMKKQAILLLGKFL